MQPSRFRFGKRNETYKMGIVIHTEYKGGPTLQDMSASFNIDVSGLGSTSDVWYQDASYRDTSGMLTFTKAEKTAMDVVLSKLGKTPRNQLKRVWSTLKLQSQFSGSIAGASVKTFINANIRKGQLVKICFCRN